MGEYIILQYLFFVTTLGFLTFFDYLAKRKLGVDSQGYLNLRMPKFFSLFIASFTAIISIYCLQKDLIGINLAGFLSVPYFAAVSYFIVAFFREIKLSKASR